MSDIHVSSHLSLIHYLTSQPNLYYYPAVCSLLCSLLWFIATTLMWQKPELLLSFEVDAYSPVGASAKHSVGSWAVHTLLSSHGQEPQHTALTEAKGGSWCNRSLHSSLPQHLSADTVCKTLISTNKICRVSQVFLDWFPSLQEVPGVINQHALHFDTFTSENHALYRNSTAKYRWLQSNYSHTTMCPTLKYVWKFLLGMDAVSVTFRKLDSAFLNWHNMNYSWI